MSQKKISVLSAAMALCVGLWAGAAIAGQEVGADSFEAWNSVPTTELGEQSGKKDTTQVNLAELGAKVSHNTAIGVQTGAITLTDSFQNIHGVASGVINSGANAVIQNSMNVNIVLH